MTSIDPMDLVLLMEEASEVVKAAAKVLRFGPDNYWPGYDNDMTKLESLKCELGELLAILDRLGISVEELDTYRRNKLHRLETQWGPEVRGRGML